MKSIHVGDDVSYHYHRGGTGRASGVARPPGVPGVFDARDSFRLDAREGVRTRLTEAEEFSGFLLPLMGTVLDRTRAGFEAMNEALRVRAESAAATEGVL
jgi:hypothetical protein